jgi:hypothetical protein
VRLESNTAAEEALSRLIRVPGMQLKIQRQFKRDLRDISRTLYDEERNE